MSSYRISVPQLENVTRAMGYVCVYWAWLEDHIGEMILDLAPLDPKQLVEKEREQLRDVLLMDTDIRTKLKLLRAVAFIRKWDDAWFKQVDKTLNKIDNDIRPRRNRVVHSTWFAGKGRIVRKKKTASLKKPQAFAQQQLITNELVRVKMPELWKLGHDIIGAEIKLVRLQLRHEAVQNHVNEETSKIEMDSWLRVIGQTLADNPARLLSLIAIANQPNPHQASGGTRRRNAPAKPPPRRRSSRKKPPP